MKMYQKEINLDGNYQLNQKKLKFIQKNQN